MLRFSNHSFLATALSFLVIPSEGADLQCPIRVPRSYRSTTSINHTESSRKHQPETFVIGFPGVVRGTADSSLSSRISC